MSDPNDFDPDAVTPVLPTTDPLVMRAPWLTIAKLELQRQVHELAGDADNPRIREYLACVGLPHDHDETPWCSAFANWCMEKAGLLGTRRANARSWLGWGQELAVPAIGCVVVFSRPPDPAHGHVAFFVGETPTHIEVIGGNQGNSVSRTLYIKERWLAYRWPRQQGGI